MKNIGNIIKQHCKHNNISVYKLARKLNLTPPALYRILNKNDMKLSQLSAISKALNHDFFQYLSSKQHDPGEKTKEITAENTFLKNKNTLLEQENKYLKDINELLRSQTWNSNPQYQKLFRPDLWERY